MISLKKHFATENRPFDWCIEQYPNRLKESEYLINVISNKFDIKKDSKILEIGAAQGLSILSIKKIGYEIVGIEPSEEAIEVSKKLSKHYNIKLEIKKGYGENIPYDDDTFDVVIADSVIEHVKDVEKVFKEIYRVLKKSGCFYFSTASSLCPKQNEIRFFPFFSWYPDKLKISIMKWAVEKKPQLVGNTAAPAINWFTPWKAKKLLNIAGFNKVYDRWEMMQGKELSRSKEILLNMISSNKIIKITADVFRQGCAYLGIKSV